VRANLLQSLLTIITVKRYTTLVLGGLYIVATRTTRLRSLTSTNKNSTPLSEDLAISLNPSPLLMYKPTPPPPTPDPPRTIQSFLTTLLFFIATYREERESRRKVSLTPTTLTLDAFNPHFLNMRLQVIAVYVRNYKVLTNFPKENSPNVSFFGNWSMILLLHLASTL
jgi:hypothetical protein